MDILPTFTANVIFRIYDSAVDTDFKVAVITCCPASTADSSDILALADVYKGQVCLAILYSVE